MNKSGMSVVLLLALLGCGCSVSCLLNGEVGNEICIASYNVQTFFDADDSGIEYSEFTGKKSQWTAEKYAERLNRLAEVIRSIGKSGPDIIVLHELENEYVLQDIQNQFYGGESYPYSGFVSPQMGQSIMSAVLSRIPLCGVTSLQINSNVAVRPTVEVAFTAGGYEFALFACHWKSKLSKDGSDCGIRRHQSAAVAQRIAHLQECNPGIHIIVAGDLNETHLENNALATDSTTASVLCISSEAPQASGILYEPWFNAPANACGSYFYNGTWETIDHLLFGSQFFDNTGAEFAQFSVHRPAEITDTETGAPLRYRVFTGNGYSDHFPVTATIRFVTSN